MRPIILVGLCAGAGLLALLLAHFGIAPVALALGKLGWPGFGLVIVYHLGLVVVMGAGWWALGRGRAGSRLRRFVWGRIVRDGASEALPLSQVGGFVLGTRALVLTGIDAPFAAASMVVDVTAELVAQLVYTLLGVALLLIIAPGSGLAWPIGGGVVAMGALAAGFVAFQSRGVCWIERGTARLAQQWLGAQPGRAGAVQAEIHALHASPARLALSSALHLAAWLLNGLEAWITLRLMGVSIGLEAAIALDSLLYGIRSVAFMVPNAIGVQEGAYVLLGGVFGVEPDVALALSLIRRGRDLAIGIPALQLWQLIEGRRAWRGPVPACPDAVGGGATGDDGPITSQA